MSSDDTSISCPACGESFVAGEAAFQQCPHCGEQFFVDSDQAETDEDREARDALERRRMQEKERLDDRQIRVVQLEKRALYRSRSWMLVIGLLLVGISGQLVWRGVAQMSQDSTRAIAYFVVAVGLAGFSVRFFRRARDYLREARQMTLPEPTTPPDFSTLSDGSQVVDNLRALADGDERTQR